MNKSQAEEIKNEAVEALQKWAEENGYIIRGLGGTYSDTSYVLRIEITEKSDSGLPIMSRFDQEVMSNHLRDTPWVGRDPRGHKFFTTHKKPHVVEILNFKYGNFPWVVKDLTTGESSKYKTQGIKWDSEA